MLRLRNLRRWPLCPLHGLNPVSIVIGAAGPVTMDEGSDDVEDAGVTSTDRFGRSNVGAFASSGAVGVGLTRRYAEVVPIGFHRNGIESR